MPYGWCMAHNAGKVHVVRVKKTGYVDKQGRRRDYSSAYLRRTYRAEGAVRNETVANLSALPDHVIDWIDAGLKGQRLVPAGEALTITRSLPHGHVAAVSAMAHKLGLSALLGPVCRERDLVLALIISRVVNPGSKLSTLTWWSDTTLGSDLGVEQASTDEIYAAMDWLEDRQTEIEKALSRRHLDPKVNPSRMALFDLSSSWVEGRCCPLAARGYSRDGKKGKLQIEYGLLSDPDGRPVAVRVFDGNTGDPTAFVEAVKVVRDTFGLKQMVMVGDRGMITSARIDALNSSADNDMGWVTALRAPAIAKLARDDGPLQMSLFDQHDLAEITHPDYPDERLIACRNPLLAAERARKRGALLDATQELLDQLVERVRRGTLAGADDIGVALGKVINKYKVGKHFEHTITDTSLTIQRKQAQIDAEDALDLRPIHHRLEDRVKAHVLICMLACYLVWHLRKAWAPLTFTDEHPPHRDNPVAPAQRSAAAHAKASHQRDEYGHPYRSFGGLLDHLATLTRNQVRIAGTTTEVPMLAEPTADQRHAFDLLSATIPLTLK